MSIRLLALVLVPCCVVSIIPADGRAEEPAMPPPPPARSIPGITAQDLFPGGCVDCHVVYEEMHMDTRFSTQMERWCREVEPALLAKAQAAAPAGLTLQGRHPEVSEALRDIPNACLDCHGRESTEAPAFASMIHRIHLTGGEENHFLTLFQGECTHCHKLNQGTGHWSLASGPER